MRKLPAPRSGGHILLLHLLAGPGTFYQICERADVDVESRRVENGQRALFDAMVDAGHAKFDGQAYSITTAARDALSPPAPYVGQVAGPAYRGVPHPTPVTIVRRATGARA